MTNDMTVRYVRGGVKVVVGSDVRVFLCSVDGGGDVTEPTELDRRSCTALAGEEPVWTAQAAPGQPVHRTGRRGRDRYRSRLVDARRRVERLVRRGPGRHRTVAARRRAGQGARLGGHRLPSASTKPVDLGRVRDACSRHPSPSIHEARPVRRGRRWQMTNDMTVRYPAPPTSTGVRCCAAGCHTNNGMSRTRTACGSTVLTSSRRRTTDGGVHHAERDSGVRSRRLPSTPLRSR
jgi:hypothetical protein